MDQCFGFGLKTVLIILLALSNTCTASRTFLLVLPHQQGGWGAQDFGRGELGQMVPNDHRNNSHHVTSCSVHKDREKKEEGGDGQNGGVRLPKSAVCVMEPSCAGDD